MTTDGRNGLTRWIKQAPDDALGALKAIWEQGDSTIDARIRAFSDLLPDSVIHGLGTRIRAVSVLLMGLDATRYPPFAAGAFENAYKQTGYAQPEGNADEADLYAHALEFLDQFLKEARARRARLRHRLDAQSIVWLWRKLPDDLPQLGLPFPECPNGVETENGHDGWDEFVRRANELISSGNLNGWENDYKRELARDLEKAREELFADTDKWVSLVDRGLTSNLIYFTNRLNFREWMINPRDKAREALRAIWTEDSLSVDQRIRAFCEKFPRKVIGGGGGTRMNLASVLLMGLDVKRFPPFRIRVFQKVCRRTGYDPPGRGADEATLYEHFLGFLDQFIEEAAEHEVHLSHRLDAQGVVWQLQNHLPKLGAQLVEPKPLHALADELFLPPDFLKEICALLDDKRQVIFQGPPGTGKTYVAQELAEHLAESGGRVTPVQFHPSYAYEDFVRGFRPMITGSGQAGFDLQDGPLLRAAQKARAEPGAKHFLLIDEINRGNLAKLFGELYFLLEYRDDPIHMQYQRDDEDDFSLPENLYIIGTMNTADRSIALVDLALRRRFYFVEFHPDDEPVKSVLRKWLEKQGLQEMVWVADVVEEANKLLQQDDKHAAIGPSYFMMEDLDEDDVRRIWKHSVLPYIEERLFGDDNRLDEFDLDKLKDKAAQTHNQKEAQEQTDGPGEGNASG